MKNFHYISDILTNEESIVALKKLVNPRMYTLLTKDNSYPMIEHDNKHDLFVLIIPVYEEKKHIIRRVECNILISRRDLYILTNSHEPIIDTIISHIQEQRKEYDSTIYTLILKLNSHILGTIDHLERIIEQFKAESGEDHGYTEKIIQDIMALKMNIGMVKSTVSPLCEVIEQLFTIINHPDAETRTIRTNQVAYIVKQMAAETNYLYENISILADTSNAIQNIRANNIMKTLTIISSIFIPLSFIAGVLGMNFPVNDLFIGENFYVAIIMMAVVGGMMYSVFRYKKWF